MSEPVSELGAAPTLGRLLNIGDRLRCLAACLTAVDPNLADTLLRNRKPISVGRLETPIEMNTPLFPGVGVTDGIGLVLHGAAQDAVAATQQLMLLLSFRIVGGEESVRPCESFPVDCWTEAESTCARNDTSQILL